eukprot:m.33577 g.33577  ORF g.33577 m.33577 type:complete len:97 (+) comp5033_c0_seq2:136-426(+)
MHTLSVALHPSPLCCPPSVGRTARNGSTGHAISLVESGEQLVADTVEAVLDNVGSDAQRFDPVFSRKRSLRRRAKRYRDKQAAEWGDGPHTPSMLP